MDRRGFLRLAGVGGALIAAAPKLIVPPVRNALADPERRIFLPPNGGWLVDELRQQWTDHWKQPAARQWTLRLERPWLPVDGDLRDLGGPVAIGGACAFLMERSIDYSYGSAVMVTERYIGDGPTPNLDEIRYGARAWLSVESPRQLFRLAPIPGTSAAYIDALVERT